MKILITSDWYKPAINGVVTSIINLEEELRKLGHDVRILTLSRTISSHIDGNVYYIKSIPFNIYPEVRASVLLFDKIIEDIIAWKPDVIHTQCEFFTYTYGKIVANRTKAPIVHTYHTMYEDYSSYLKIKKEFGRYLIGFMSKNRLKDATIVIAPTLKVRRKLKSYQISNEIKIIPSGIDIEKFNKPISENVIRSLKDKYKIPKDNKVLLYLGRIGKEKNLEELINYFYYFTLEDKSVTLLIVGGGPYENNIRALINKLKLKDHVIMTGMVAPEEVSRFYKLGDIFVSASQSETQGLTYIEGKCNGLPLLCKYDESLEGVLVEGENGYFFSNKEDFIENINKILSNNILYDKLRNNSLEKRDLHSKEYFARSIERVYLLAINLNKNKPRVIDFSIEHFGKIFNIRHYWKRRLGENFIVKKFLGVKNGKI